MTSPQGGEAVVNLPKDSKYEVIMCCDCDGIIKIRRLDKHKTAESAVIQNLMTAIPWCNCLYNPL